MIKAKKLTTAEIHKMIADKVIKLMETEGSNWTKSWANKAGMGPTSLSTGNPYQGINWLILGMERAEKGYSSHEWATFNQYKKMGASVRKGEKSTMVILYKKVVIKDKETDEKKSIPLLKTFRVFNADQVDGYTAEPVADIKDATDNKPTTADDIAIRVGAKVVNDDLSSAFYVLSKDYINMPVFGQFNSSEDYSVTLLHELTHWTGHEKRLDRNIKNSFGSKDYAKEELIAELGSAMMCGSLGITPEPRADHAKYLNNWIERLKKEPKVIFSASAKANQATQFIFDAANVQQTEVLEVA